MTDIVERIRCRINDAPMPTEHLLDEAADEIERLRAAIQGVMESSWEAEREPVHTVSDGAYQRMVEALGFRAPGQPPR